VVSVLNEKEKKNTYTHKRGHFKEFGFRKQLCLQTLWLGNVYKQIYLGKAKVDNGLVQERATLCNEQQNEISWAECAARADSAIA